MQMTTSLLVLIADFPGTQVTCSIEGLGRPNPDHVFVMAVYRGPALGSEAARGMNFDIVESWSLSLRSCL